MQGRRANSETPKKRVELDGIAEHTKPDCLVDYPSRANDYRSQVFLPRCRPPSTTGPASILESMAASAPAISNWSDGVIGTTGSFPTSGFLVGGTAGVNYQIAEYVFGIEGDGDWTNLRGNSGSTCGAISAVVTPTVSCQTQSQWLATVRGRIGYAFDRIQVGCACISGGSHDNCCCGHKRPPHATPPYATSDATSDTVFGYRAVTPLTLSPRTIHQLRWIDWRGLLGPPSIQSGLL
jgi:hypothetical protein